MSSSSIESLKIKAKLLQKAKQRAGQAIALKDAYNIIARNAGYPSWREYKFQIENSVDLAPNGKSAFWKTWYSNYDQARTHFETSTENYLLPYGKNQFFVCDIHHVEALGVDRIDVDLARVGRDWTEPKDEKAMVALLSKIKNATSRR